MSGPNQRCFPYVALNRLIGLALSCRVAAQCESVYPLLLERTRSFKGNLEPAAFGQVGKSVAADGCMVHLTNELLPIGHGRVRNLNCVKSEILGSLDLCYL